LNQTGKDDFIIFATESEALCFYVSRWLYERLKTDKDSDTAKDMLRRMRFITSTKHLNKMFDMCITSDSSLDWDSPYPITNEETLATQQMKLLVVDEAHEFFATKNKDVSVFNTTIKALIKQKASQSNCGLLLLSDDSQASSDVDWSELGEMDVSFKQLTVNSRSTKRISLAARFYQTRPSDGGDKCVHDIDGPRPKSYIFPLAEDSANTFQTYAEKTIEAVTFMKNQFMTGVDLDMRIAIAVPDKKFQDQLVQVKEGDLRSKLKETMDLEVVSALDAMQNVRTTTSSSNNRENSEKSPRIVIDTVSALNGLEFMGVVAVGLDKEMLLTDEEETRKLHQSLLYRAITRSRFTCALVNEHVRNGWLSWLLHASTQGNERDRLDFDRARDLVDSEKMFTQLNVAKKKSFPNGEKAPKDAASKEGTDTSKLAEDTDEGNHHDETEILQVEEQVFIRQDCFDTSSNNATIESSNPQFLPMNPRKAFEHVSVLNEVERSDNVSALCFSPDGSKLVVGGEDKKAAVYETRSWTEIASMDRGAEVNALCFSLDGSKLVVGGWDNTAAVYETRSWTEIASMERSYEVYALCFSPDGSKLVVGGVDNKAAVYDVYADRTE
jgi:hypothetical protein